MTKQEYINILVMLESETNNPIIYRNVKSLIAVLTRNDIEVVDIIE